MLSLGLRPCSNIAPLCEITDVNQLPMYQTSLVMQIPFLHQLILLLDCISVVVTLLLQSSRAKQMVCCQCTFFQPLLSPSSKTLMINNITRAQSILSSTYTNLCLKAIASNAIAPKIRRRQNTRMTIVSRSSRGGTAYIVSVANDCDC